MKGSSTGARLWLCLFCREQLFKVGALLWHARGTFILRDAAVIQ